MRKYPCILEKLISGGQAGADRGGLEAARRLGFPYGGYVPLGRISEDGVVPEKYKNLIELPTTSYPARTRMNVEKSDATWIIVRNTPLSPGSLLTRKTCEELDKPFNIIRTSAVDSIIELIEKALEWLGEYEIKTLNVAGTRESKAPGIERDAFRLVTCLLAATYRFTSDD